MALQVGSLVVAEMLYRTNLVAMVAGGRKPKFADNTVLCYKYDKRYKSQDYVDVLIIRLLIKYISSTSKHHLCCTQRPVQLHFFILLKINIPINCNFCKLGDDF